jgi:predicted dehydrogenase
MGRPRAEVCARTAGAELVAVCDIWDERAREVGQALGVEVVRDYERLLERKDIDAVGLWTPSGMHGRMAIQALQAGKHVCTTKPFDLDTAVCDQAIRLADTKRLVLAVDFESRYHPVNNRARSALRSGAIGRILFADLRVKWYRSQGYYDSGMPEGWRSRLKTERGSLSNQAVHYLDLLQWWIGPVRRVVGKRKTLKHRIETEDGTVSVLELESGALVMVFTTTASFPDFGTVMEVSGSRGTLGWSDQKVTLFRAMRNVEPGVATDGAYVEPENREKPEAVDLRLEDFEAPPDLPLNIIDDMVRAVRDGRPVACDGREGRKTVAIIQAVYESSDRDSWVEVRY